MGGHDAGLFSEASAFADDVADLLESTVAEQAPVRADVQGDRVVVAPLDDDGANLPVPLDIRAQRAARLRIEYECAWDHERRFLAIEESRFALLSGVLGEPILRIEYLRGEDSPARAAHVHVHGECTQLGALYAAARVVDKANLQRLHIPVGGKRFRPCLEDVLEFLISDLGVDAS